MPLYNSLLGWRGIHPPTVLPPPSSSSISNPTFLSFSEPFSTPSVLGRGGKGGFGLSFSSSGVDIGGGDWTRARALMKLGFGGTGGLGRPSNDTELARRETSGS